MVFTGSLSYSTFIKYMQWTRCAFAEEWNIPIESSSLHEQVCIVWHAIKLEKAKMSISEQSHRANTAEFYQIKASNNQQLSTQKEVEWVQPLNNFQSNLLFKWGKRIPSQWQQLLSIFPSQVTERFLAVCIVRKLWRAHKKRKDGNGNLRAQLKFFLLGTW